MVCMLPQDAMPFDVEAAGSANIGRQYWGRHAFVRCNAALCAKQLRALLEQRDPDVLQGALLLASTFAFMFLVAKSQAFISARSRVLVDYFQQC